LDEIGKGSFALVESGNTLFVYFEEMLYVRHVFNQQD
jgi:hypothetical protein